MSFCCHVKIWFYFETTKRECTENNEQQMFFDVGGEHRGEEKDGRKEQRNASMNKSQSNRLFVLFFFQFKV